jgi:hypothetical protein
MSVKEQKKTELKWLANDFRKICRLGLTMNRVQVVAEVVAEAVLYM